MLATLLILVGLVLIIWLYLQQAKFGKAPSGARLQRIQQSPNFKEGKFQNQSHTPDLTEGYGYTGVMIDFLFKKVERRIPTNSLPSVKTDLRKLPLEENVLVWFGHSSYYFQLDGKRFLVDPVFSGNASPIPGTTKSFLGTDVYTVNDLPEIDYLLVSHDHYDHLDHTTIVALQSKVQKVICGLGVGSHFEHWGYVPEQLIEKDWYESIELDNHCRITLEPARHFSGRGFIRNNTLWTSYMLQSKSMTLYVGGDSGYDSHFAAIGKKYRNIDLAILENGQYDEAWRYIHNLPEDFMKAAQDLGAKRIFPVHSAKFALASHAWDEPLRAVTELNKDYNIPLLTPMIGEVLRLTDDKQVFTNWWEGVQ